MNNLKEIDAYLPDGNTLLTSVVRNKKKSMKQRKEKIRWLIRHGADVNKRDCSKYYFPPLCICDCEEEEGTANSEDYLAKELYEFYSIMS